MSSGLSPSPSRTRKAIRTSADYWVVAADAEPDVVHLPSSDSTREAPAPRCVPAELDGESYDARGTAALPTGALALCEDCRSRWLNRDRT